VFVRRGSRSLSHPTFLQLLSCAYYFCCTWNSIIYLLHSVVCITFPRSFCDILVITIESMYMYMLVDPAYYFAV